MDNQKIFMPSLTSGELMPLDSVSTAVAKQPYLIENSSVDITTLPNNNSTAPVKINNYLSPTPNGVAATPNLNNDNTSP